jgi:acetyl esterase/lipase
MLASERLGNSMSWVDWYKYKTQWGGDLMNNKNKFSIFLFVLIVLGYAHFTNAQGTPELLWANVASGPSGDSANFKPTLLSYPVIGSKANGAAVLICPGGGYYGLAYDHEGIDVAKRFNTYGVSAFVVKYRRALGFAYPVPIDDARRAMRMIRSRAKSLGIDTSRIGIMGFSAGGHLAATVTTHFDIGDKLATDTVDRMSCKPAFSILIYPVISMKPDITHLGSRDNLIGKTPDSNLVNFLSNELQVTKNTPPSFLVHTKDDGVVKFANSQLFYDACIKAKVPAKYMLFDKGPHGFGMANGINGAPNLPELAVWPDTCAKWLETNGFFKATVGVFGITSPSRSNGLSVVFRNGRIVVAGKSRDLNRTNDLSGKSIEVLNKL